MNRREYRCDYCGDYYLEEDSNARDYRSYCCNHCEIRDDKYKRAEEDEENDGRSKKRGFFRR